MTDHVSPPPPPTAPVSPYGAHLPAAMPGAPEPGGYVPLPDAAPAPPRPTGGAALAGTALTLAILGVLVTFAPGLIALAGVLLIVVSIVLAIVHLVGRRDGRGLSIAALVVAGVGGVVSGLVAVMVSALAQFGAGGMEIITGDDSDYDYVELGAPGLAGAATSRDDALEWGTTVVVTDTVNGGDVWEVTVGRPLDITDEIDPDVDMPPEFGAYLAVPIEITNVSDTTITDIDWDYGLYSWLLTGDGGRAEPTWLTLSDYTNAWDDESLEPGESTTYYEIYDVAPSVIDSGTAVIELYDTSIHWAG
jgi:hypothetical protein